MVRLDIRDVELYDVCKSGSQTLHRQSWKWWLKLSFDSNGYGVNHHRFYILKVCFEHHY